MNPKHLGSALLCLIMAVTLMAQSAEKRMFIIHEDRVKPSKVLHYEETARELQALLKKHGSAEMAYNAASSEDFTYLYISEISSFAELDKDPWAGFTAKVGEETMEDLWNSFDKCYDVHRNYLVSLSPELSYVPEDDVMADNGHTFRRWNYYYIQPEFAAEGDEVARAWKALYEKHNVSNGYRVYRSGLGQEMHIFTVVRWAQDAAAMDAIQASEQALFGEEGSKLWERTLAVCRKIDSRDGQMRPDLAYLPDETTTVELKE